MDNKIKLEKRISKLLNHLSLSELNGEIELIKNEVEFDLIDKCIDTDEVLDKVTYILSKCNLIKIFRIKIKKDFSIESLAHFFETINERNTIKSLSIYFKNIKEAQFSLIDNFFKKTNQNLEQISISVRHPQKELNDILLTTIINSISNNSTLISLDLSSNIFYSDSPLKTLNALLSNSLNNIYRLRLVSVNIHYGSISNLNEIISNRFNIQKIDLSQCNLNYSFFQRFTEKLLSEKISTITKLKLCANNIDKRCIEVFQSYLLSDLCNIEKINFKGNYIGDQGCKVLWKYISLSRCIRKLDLSQNFIYDDGIKSLARGIELNNSLEILRISDNYFTDFAIVQFCEKIKNKKESFKLRELDITWNKVKAGGIIAIGELYENFPFETIYISDNKVNEEIACEFLEKIAHTRKNNIKSIDLSFNEIGNNSMIYVSEIVNNSGNVSRLNLQKNRISKDGIHNLSICLINNNIIQYLNLSKNLLSDEGCIFLADSLKNNNVLKSLYIGENKISNAGITAIAEIILVKDSIVSLECSHNFIKSEGAKAIGENLKIATGIKKLIMNSNQIGDEGAFYLSEGINENNCLEEINLENNDIYDKGIECISKALMGKKNFMSLNIACNKFKLPGSIYLTKIINNLDTITFSSTPICNKSFKNLLEAYQTNPNLKKFKLTNSEIGSKEGSVYLIEGLKKNETVKKFDFSYAKFDEISSQLIFPSISWNNTITFLDLKNNNLGDGGIQGLSQFLKNSCLKYLYLQTNKISKQGVHFIAEALKINKTLLVLNLSDNRFGNHGMNSLSNALLENKTLKSLYVGYTGLSYYCINKLDIVLKKNSSLQSLFIYGNNIGDKGANIIFKSLLFNKSLIYLSIGSNGLSDKATKDIEKYLAVNNKLIALELNTNKLNNESAKRLAKIISLNDKLHEINLINNSIDFEGVSRLIHSMEKNGSINQIKLLLNLIPNNEKKIIVSSSAHLIFN